MTKTAQAIPELWINSIIQSNHFKTIHDYKNSLICFPEIQVNGGIQYFLWKNNYYGKCQYFFYSTQEDILKRYDYLDSKHIGIIIRDPQNYSILEKIEAVENKYYKNSNTNFSGLVSSKHFLNDRKFLTSNWSGYKDKKDSIYNIKYYLNIKSKRTFRWISESQIPKNKDVKDIYKIFIPAAYGTKNDDIILGKPFLGEPNSVCSQTFLVIGYDIKKHNFSETECYNIISYIQTKFFRYLVSIKKKTQNGPRGIYQFVPLQDFSVEWTDEKLYKKYNLTESQIQLIESSIRQVNYIENKDKIDEI